MAPTKITRRTFTAAASALALTAASARRVLGANERVRLGFIGVGNRGSQLLDAFDKLADIQVAAVCDIYKPYLDRTDKRYDGKAAPGDAPPDLDWDMWLGPRPGRKFQATIHPYKFRWHDLYSSQMANWGVHYLDAIRWLVGEEAPPAVVAVGGRYALDDDRT